MAGTEFIKDISFSVGDIIVWGNEHTRTEHAYLILETPVRQIDPDLLSATAFKLDGCVKTLFSCRGNEFNLSHGTWLKVHKANSDTYEFYCSPMGCGRAYSLYEARQPRSHL